MLVALDDSYRRMRGSIVAGFSSAFRSFGVCRQTALNRREDVMKITAGIMVAAALVFLGFAAGFPVGKSIGFETGSEWAIVQADLLAREAGVFMPVYLDEGKFRVVVKQPRDLHRKAWHLADDHHSRTGILDSVSGMEGPGLDQQRVEGGGQRIGLLRAADTVIR